MRASAIIFLLSLGTVTLLAQTVQTKTETPSFEQTIEWSRQTLDAAKAELESVRSEIAAQQKPLIQTLTSARAKLAGLQREDRQLAFETEGMKHAVERLAEQVQSQTDHHRNIQHRTLYLRRKFEESLPTIESPRYRPAFLDLEKTGDQTTDQRLAQLKALFAIAGSAIDRLDSQIGGSRYPATALTDGVVEKGTAFQYGPYAFFAPEAGPPGLIVAGANLAPRLRRLSPKSGSAIAEAIAGRPASLPFDPLLDQAFLNADAETTLWEHLKSGGLWIIPITFFGLVSSLIALLKFLQIRSIHAPEKEQITPLVTVTEQADFDRQLAALAPPVRPIFAEGFAYRNAPETARAAAMGQVLLDFRDLLEGRLSLLALTAAVAPLLGLLGTVTGMIKTFQVISLHGAGDARTLSGGISEALVTTELGLVVAIPALLAHAWLSRRARRITVQTSSLAERFHKTLPQAGNRA